MTWQRPEATVSLWLAGENGHVVVVVGLYANANANATAATAATAAPAPASSEACTPAAITEALLALFPPAPPATRARAATLLAACRVPRAEGALGAVLAHDPPPRFKRARSTRSTASARRPTSARSRASRRPPRPRLPTPRTRSARASAARRRRPPRPPSRRRRRPQRRSRQPPSRRRPPTVPTAPPLPAAPLAAVPPAALAPRRRRAAARAVGAAAGHAARDRGVDRRGRRAHAQPRRRGRAVERDAAAAARLGGRRHRLRHIVGPRALRRAADHRTSGLVREHDGLGHARRPRSVERQPQRQPAGDLRFARPRRRRRHGARRVERAQVAHDGAADRPVGHARARRGAVVVRREADARSFAHADDPSTPSRRRSP